MIRCQLSTLTVTGVYVEEAQLLNYCQSLSTIAPHSRTRCEQQATHWQPISDAIIPQVDDAGVPRSGERVSLLR